MPSYIFGYALAHLFAGTSFEMLALAVVSGVVFLALFLIQALMANNFRILACIAAGESLAMLLAFYPDISAINGAAAVILLVLLLWAYFFGSREANNVFKIRLSQIGPVIVGRALTGLSIFVTIAYLGTVNFFEPAAARQFIFGLIKPVEPLTLSIVGGIMPGATGALRESGLLSAESLTDIIYQSTAAKILLLPKLYKNLIMAAVGLLIFLTMKGLSPLIRILVVPLAFIFYRFLQAFGFFHIELESRSKEIIKV